MIRKLSSFFIVLGVLYIPIMALLSFFVTGKYNIISSFIGVILMLTGFLLQIKRIEIFRSDRRLFGIIFINILYIAFNSVINQISEPSFYNLIINYIFLFNLIIGTIVLKNIKHKTDILSFMFWLLLFYVLLLTGNIFTALAKHSFDFQNFRYIISIEFQENGLFINFLSLRNYLVTGLLLLVYHTSPSRNRKGATLFMIFFILIFSFLSGSRQALLGTMGITLVYFFIILKPSFRKIFSYFLITLFIMTIFQLIGINMNIFEMVFTDRYFVDNRLLLDTDIDRISLIAKSLQIFEKNPIFGIGESITYILNRDPHNTYVQILAEKGIVGMVLFMLILLHFIKHKGINKEINMLKNTYIFFIIFVYLFTNVILSAYDLFLTLILLYAYSDLELQAQAN